MKSDYSAEFERFWKLYPRKIGKRAAWLVWQRQIAPRGVLASMKVGLVIDALTRQVEGGHFSADNAFIPHPRTWLHQGRWEDEVTQPSTAAWQAASSWKPRIRNCPKCHTQDRGHEDTCQQCDWTREAWEAKRKQATR